jgi:predicted RNA polymerase sigma factor
VIPPDVEGLLRELAPQALGAVARRYGEFVNAEDAVQEPLATAAVEWPAVLPDRPLSWLITVASRRLVDEYRRNDARRRREELAASLSIQQEQTVPSSDDSLVMLFLCCGDTLSSASVGSRWFWPQPKRPDPIAVLRAQAATRARS